MMTNQAYLLSASYLAMDNARDIQNITIVLEDNSIIKLKEWHFDNKKCILTGVTVDDEKMTQEYKNIKMTAIQWYEREYDLKCKCGFEWHERTINRNETTVCPVCGKTILYPKGEK